jgi:hypothetical protein
MKSIFNLKLYSILAFAVCFAGCSSAKTASAENELAIKFSPTPTPQSSVEESKDDSVKNENWQIPLLKNRKQTRISFSDTKSEDGKPVRLMITDYAPKNEVFFTQVPSGSVSPNRLLSGLLKLEFIEELRVKEKIFGYVVFARATKTDEKTGKPSPFGQMFVYRIIDKDGDGKFETLLADDSKILVPQWVSK